MVLGPRKHLQSSFHRQTSSPQEQFYQRGDGLVALIRELGKRFKKKKSLEQQTSEYLSHLRGSFPGERSSILAAAMLAKKSLDSTRQVSVPFPEEYLDGSRTIDSVACEFLHSYLQELQKLHGEMVRFNSLFSLAVAKGLKTWIVSLHILTRPELLPEGREAWALMLRAEKGAEEAYRMLLRRQLSDVDKAYLAYRPLVFLPDDDTA
ncbi:MAG: hypothetical protein CMG46_05880 [Candidatus Marinimicrobia bacterium]|nr:hypothetical protein [Candidatus Neomarinimicrobiota bacterium]